VNGGGGHGRDGNKGAMKQPHLNAGKRAQESTGPHYTLGWRRATASLFGSDRGRKRKNPVLEKTTSSLVTNTKMPKEKGGKVFVAGQMLSLQNGLNRYSRFFRPFKEKSSASKPGGEF